MLRDLSEGADLWALPVFVLGEFLRVVTHQRLFSPPSAPRVRVAAVDALLASPTVQVLHPGGRYWPLLQDTIGQSRATGNLIMDAAIVAVCREHGVRTIVSNDRDFHRFPTVQLRTLD